MSSVFSGRDITFCQGKQINNEEKSSLFIKTLLFYAISGSKFLLDLHRLVFQHSYQIQFYFFNADMGQHSP